MSKRICSYPECEKAHRAKGLCAGHWQQQRKGVELYPLGEWDRPIAPVKDRFWSKVRKTESCWIWTASKKPNGYGQINNGKNSMIVAHRVSYQLFHGPISDDVMLDHICHNRACVNPEHLRVVTNTQNNENRKGANKNSKTGIRGVRWNARMGKWIAESGRLGKTVHIGSYSSIEDAEMAAIQWRRENMTHNLLDWSPARVVPAGQEG